MQIDCGDFILRTWKKGDEFSLVVHANNYEIWRNLRDIFPHPYTYKDAEDWLRIANLNYPAHNFAIEVDGQAAGGIEISFKDDIYKKNAEINYWLGEQYWGRGIVSRAVSIMSDYTFEHFDILKIYASVFEGNERSERLLKKVGFEYEAVLKKAIFKNNRFYDELIYTKWRPMDESIVE